MEHRPRSVKVCCIKVLPFCAAKCPLSTSIVSPALPIVVIFHWYWLSYGSGLLRHSIFKVKPLIFKCVRFKYTCTLFEPNQLCLTSHERDINKQCTVNPDEIWQFATKRIKFAVPWIVVVYIYICIYMFLHCILKTERSIRHKCIHMTPPPLPHHHPSPT